MKPVRMCCESSCFRLLSDFSLEASIRCQTVQSLPLLKECQRLTCRQRTFHSLKLPKMCHRTIHSSRFWRRQSWAMIWHTMTMMALQRCCMMQSALLSRQALRRRPAAQHPLLSTKVDFTPLNAPKAHKRLFFGVIILLLM